MLLVDFESLRLTVSMLLCHLFEVKKERKNDTFGGRWGK